MTRKRAQVRLTAQNWLPFPVSEEMLLFVFNISHIYFKYIKKSFLKLGMLMKFRLRILCPLSLNSYKQKRFLEIAKRSIVLTFDKRRFNNLLLKQQHPRFFFFSFSFPLFCHDKKRRLLFSLISRLMIKISKKTKFSHNHLKKPISWEWNKENNNAVLKINNENSVLWIIRCKYESELHQDNEWSKTCHPE